jgi:hypothetical protein
MDLAATMVASALVGRVVSEDPSVLRIVRTVLTLLEPGRDRLRRRPEDEPAAR